MRNCQISVNSKLDLQELTLVSPKSTTADSVKSQKSQLVKEPIRKMIDLQKNNATYSSNMITVNNKQNNEVGALAFAISYCLNTQSKIADSVREIGLHLKDLTENANATAASSRKQINLSFSSPKNLSVNRSKDRISNITSIQNMLSKLDSLKKEIVSKTFDFETCFQFFGFCDSFHSKSNHFEEQSYCLSPKLIQKPEENPKVSKHIQEAADSKSDNFQLNDVSNRINSLPFDLKNCCIDSLNEVPNTGKLFADTPNNENSRLLQISMLSPNNESSRCDKNFDKTTTINSHKTGTSIIFKDPNVIKNQETSQHEKLTPSASIGKFSKNTNLKPSKSKENVSNTKIIFNTIFSQISHKKLQKNNRTQIFPNTELKTTLCQSSKGLRRVNIADHRRITSFGGTPNDDILKSPHSPHGYNAELNQRKNFIKPASNIIPQKQIIDDSVRDNIIDQTIQCDKSTVNLPENTQNITIEEKPANLDTDRIYSKTEANELKQDHLYSFLKNIANKEKAIIKNLMKERPLEDAYFQKADSGKINQKKYLINSRWWRTWKEFVNFDSEEGTFTKTSFFEMGLYPRPGQINNRELLREEAISDLVNISPELELKENLLEHHDYEGVNKKVYDVLVSWYGSDFEICRVLKPDPLQDNKLYLDLYPKKKLSGRSIPKSLDTGVPMNYVNAINNIIISNLNHK